MILASTFGFRVAAEAVERAALERLALQPLPLPADLARAAGCWKDSPVDWQARVYTGPRISLFRIVEVTAPGMEIVNVLGMARSPLDAPIFGADFVAARPDQGLIVADLSPLSLPGSTDDRLPTWARTVFSASPIVERVTPSTAGAAIERASAAFDRFTQLVLTAAPTDVSARSAAIERYLNAHLDDERMRTMLSHMFGATLSQRLWDAVLFPREFSLHAHA